MSGPAPRGVEPGSRELRPPPLAEALLVASLPLAERDEVVGDMAERYARRGGGLAATAWYWRQALAIPLRLRWREAVAGISTQEVRHAARSLRNSPVFTVVAVLSLSLGIGANAAIFSVVRSVLYTPLAVDRPHELRLAYHTQPDDTDGTSLASSSQAHPQTGVPIHSNYSYPAYQNLRAALDGSADLLAYAFARRVAVVIDGQPAVSAEALMGSGDFFSTLRPEFALGRPFDPGDDRPGAERVVVISHAFWQRELGGDPSVVGRVLSINGASFEIVGVTAADFRGLSPGGFFGVSDLTVPLASAPVVAPSWPWSPDSGSLLAAYDYNWIRVIVRAADADHIAPLEDAMTASLRESMVTGAVIDPADADRVQVHFLDGSRGLDSLRDTVEQPIVVLGAVVSVVFLIACINLAGLMLARGAARRQELAVRRALGASRPRLVRQLLLESLLLALAGGGVGLLLALWSGPALTAALTASVGEVAVRFELDGALVAAVLGISLAAAVLCGALPALRLTRRDTHDAVRSHGSAESGGRLTLGRALIVAQIAASIPLVVGAGLFLRTLENLGDVDLGFDPHDLVIFRLEPVTITDDPDRVAAIYRQVIDELGAEPGVLAVSPVENALVTGWTSNTIVLVDGAEEPVRMYMNAVGPGFFELMRIPVIAGRTLLPSDDAGAPLVMVVNETAERELFGGEAVGRFVRRNERDYEVVGVVADFKYQSLRREPEPTFYDAYVQRGMSRTHMMVRTSIPVDRLEPTIRDVVARAAPGLPVNDIISQSAQIAAATSRERVFARVLALFGGFALLVASVGLYGVTAFAVARRRAEIGVRLALGARPPQVLWLVLRSVLVLAAVGSTIGLIAAYWVGPAVGSMLYGLAPSDPAVMLGGASLMVLVAALAGWFPALRAARTDALIVMSRE